MDRRRAAVAGVRGCDGLCSIAVGLILSQDRPQVAVTEDQHLVGDRGQDDDHEPFGVGVRAGPRAGIITASAPVPASPFQAGNQVNVLVAGLARRPSVPVRSFDCRPGECTDNMADRTRREGRYQLENRRSDGIRLVRVKRSVKPSASVCRRETGWPEEPAPPCLWGTATKCSTS